MTVTEIILGQEPVIRLVLSAGIFLVLAASEAHFPRRIRSLSR